MADVSSFNDFVCEIVRKIYDMNCKMIVPKIELKLKTYRSSCSYKYSPYAFKHGESMISYEYLESQSNSKFQWTLYHLLIVHLQDVI